MVSSLGSSSTFRLELLLKCIRLPGRLSVEDAALLLGFRTHDIPVLMSVGLLKPLGNPRPAAPKWFASSEIELLRQDAQFLAKATKAVSSRWRKRNARLKKPGAPADRPVKRRWSSEKITGAPFHSNSIK